MDLKRWTVIRNISAYTEKRFTSDLPIPDTETLIAATGLLRIILSKRVKCGSK